MQYFEQAVQRLFGTRGAAPPPLGSWQISRDEQLLTSDYLHRSQVNRMQKAAHPVENLQNSFGMPNFSPTNENVFGCTLFFS